MAVPLPSAALCGVRSGRRSARPSQSPTSACRVRSCCGQRRSRQERRPRGRRARMPSWKGQRGSGQADVSEGSGGSPVELDDLVSQPCLVCAGSWPCPCPASSPPAASSKADKGSLRTVLLTNPGR
ncbi:uncharacterized protein LOC135576316 isoform X2 [Columba livia]|uniref:uncharacterized protein LOC135576316 isoform X2 n=1 Tax=Columba livia TaxID=8932 RepID=UPI0031BAEAF4